MKRCSAYLDIMVVDEELISGIEGIVMVVRDDRGGGGDGDGDNVLLYLRRI